MRTLVDNLSYIGGVLPRENATSFLSIPTYDGSGQLLHPDIADCGVSGFEGYRYWMTATPYPGNDDDYENPSVWASNDLENWVVPDGLVNPIVETPVADEFFNSDPTITFNSDDNKLVVFYRKSLDFNGNDSIRMTESSDGITWSASQEVLSFSLDKTVSPQAYYDPSGQSYSLWAIKHEGSSGAFKRIVKYTSIDGVTFSSPTNVTVNYSKAFIPWHFNIKKVGNRFVGCVATFNSGGNSADDSKLHLIVSENPQGTEFSIDNDFFLEDSNSTRWDGSSLYQSCLILKDGVYVLVYSGIYNGGPAVNRLGKIESTTRTTV